MPTLTSPNDAAAMLGIAPATLRSWAPLYDEFLSDYARKGRRQYTRRDLAVLQTVKDLLDDRNTHDQVGDLLRTMDFGEEDTAPATDTAPRSAADATSASSALVHVVTAQLAGVQQDQAARLAALEHQVSDLRVQVATLTAQLAQVAGAEHDHPAIVPTRRRRRSST